MQQQMVLPEGGLATFLTSNMDEFDDSRLAFGRQNGINSMREVAERMAKFGRNGDVHLAHLEQGEGVVPRQVRKNNPKLVSQIDAAIAAEGADPSAYVVGSETNSINPYTGQREFFLKKLVKGVKDIFKKVAPIVVPMALNFFAPGLGAIGAGALGSGISTLIQGGNFKDSLKSAAMGGFLGGMASGVKGVMTGTGTFGEKFMGGFKEYGLPKGVGGGTGEGIFGKYDSDKGLSGTKTGEFLLGEDGKPSKFKELFKNKTLTAADAQLKAAEAGFTKGTPLFDDAVLKYVADSGGYNMYKVGAGLLGAGALAGAFDPIDPEKAPDPYAGPSQSEIRLAENPDKYSVGMPVPYRRPVVEDVTPTNLYEQYMQQTQFAAKGGEMENFPRRNGYIGGPGTETSDDIPAMLSDGEFVMTARAVRGLGDGSRKKGVRKMYDMMRAFEGGAVA